MTLPAIYAYNNGLKKELKLSKRTKTVQNQSKRAKTIQTQSKRAEKGQMRESHLYGDGITTSHRINQSGIVLISALLECARRSMHRFGQRLHPYTGGNRFPMALRGPWGRLSMTKPDL